MPVHYVEQLLDEAEVAVAAILGDGFADHDLEVRLPPLAVGTAGADIAAINPDDDRPSGRGSSAWSRGEPSMKKVRSSPSSPSMRAATWCKWLRTVSALSVVPTERTSFSISTVTQNERPKTQTKTIG